MSDTEIVAILPAAGQATRLGSIPYSKEVLPLSDTQRVSTTTLGLILEQLEGAGVREAVIILREGKWDIPEYILKQEPAIEVVYKVTRPTRSVPETVSMALPGVGDSPVFLAFPDLLYQPNDALYYLVKQWREKPVDVLLALFESDRPDKSDMVELDPDGNIIELRIKTSRRDLTYAWGAAIWGAGFTRRLQKSVEEVNSLGNPSEENELYVGDIVQQALHDGMDISAVVIPDGHFLDIGTHEDLDRARRWVAKQTASN